MKLTKDMHTHTYYSHGTASIEEMVKAAVQKGLSEIHITEHGYAHYYARKLNRAKYLEMYEQIEALRIQYPQIRIVFGVEANIFSMQGDIDIKNEDLELFEVVNVGFHVMCKMKDLMSYIKIHTLAFLAYRCHLRFLQSVSEKYCTEAMVHVLDRYKIHMITHPMSNYRFDLEKVANKCVETKTILEINNSRGRLNAHEVKQIKDLDVTFVVGSDAHVPEDVGNCTKGFEIIKQSGVDIGKVLNVE